MKDYRQRLAEFLKAEKAAMGPMYNEDEAIRHFRNSEGYREVAPGEALGRQSLRRDEMDFLDNLTSPIVDIRGKQSRSVSRERQENPEEDNPYLSVIRSLEENHITLPSSVINSLADRVSNYAYDAYKNKVEAGMPEGFLERLRGDKSALELHESRLAAGFGSFMSGKTYEDASYIVDKSLLKDVLSTPLSSLGIDARRIGEDLSSRLAQVTGFNVGEGENRRKVAVTQGELRPYIQGAQHLINEPPETVSGVHNLLVRSTFAGLSEHARRLLARGSDLGDDLGNLLSSALDAARTFRSGGNAVEHILFRAFTGITSANREEMEDLATMGTPGVEISDDEYVGELGYSDFVDDIAAGPFRDEAGNVYLMGLYTKGGTLVGENNLVNRIVHDPLRGFKPLVIGTDQGPLLDEIFGSAKKVSRRELAKSKTRFGNTPVQDWLDKLDPYLGHLRGEENLPVANRGQIERLYVGLDRIPNYNPLTGAQTRVEYTALSPREMEEQLARKTLRGMTGVYPIGLFGKNIEGQEQRNVVDALGVTRSYLAPASNAGLIQMNRIGGFSFRQVALGNRELEAISRFSNIEFFRQNPHLAILASDRKLAQLAAEGILDPSKVPGMLNDPYRGMVRSAGLALLKAHQVGSRLLRQDASNSFNEYVENEDREEEDYDPIWGGEKFKRPGSSRRSGWIVQKGDERVNYWVDKGREEIAPFLDGSGAVFLDVRSSARAQVAQPGGDARFTRYLRTRDLSRKLQRRLGVSYENDPKNLLGYNQYEFGSEAEEVGEREKEQEIQWAIQEALAYRSGRGKVVEIMRAFGNKRQISVSADPWQQIVAASLNVAGRYPSPKSIFTAEETARRNQIYAIGVQSFLKGIQQPGDVLSDSTPEDPYGDAPFFYSDEVMDPLGGVKAKAEIQAARQYGEDNTVKETRAKIAELEAQVNALRQTLPEAKATPEKTPSAAVSADRDNVKERLAQMLADGARAESILGSISEEDRKEIFRMAGSIVRTRNDVIGVDESFAGRVDAEALSTDPNYSTRRALAMGGRDFLDANYPEFKRDYLGKGMSDRAKANYDAWLQSLPESERAKVHAAVKAVMLEVKGSVIDNQEGVTVTKDGYSWVDSGYSNTGWSVWSDWSRGQLDPLAYPGVQARAQTNRGDAAARIGKKSFYKIVDRDGTVVFRGEKEDVKDFYQTGIRMNAANNAWKIVPTETAPGSLFKVIGQDYRDELIPSNALPYDQAFPEGFKGRGRAVRGNLSYIRTPNGGYLDPEAFENKYVTQEERNANVVDLRTGAAAHETGHQVWWSLEDAKSKLLRKFSFHFENYRKDSKHLSRAWEANGNESSAKEEFAQALAVATTMGLDALRSTHPEYADLFDKHSEELKLAQLAAPEVIDYTDPKSPKAFRVFKGKEVSEVAGIPDFNQGPPPDDFWPEDFTQGRPAPGLPQSRQARLEVGAQLKSAFRDYVDDLAGNRLVGVGNSLASIQRAIDPATGNRGELQIVSRASGEPRVIGNEQDIDQAAGMARGALTQAFEAGNLSDDPQLFISEIKKRAVELVRDIVGKTMDRTLESSNDIDVKEVVQKFDTIGKIAQSIITRATKSMETTANSELRAGGNANMAVPAWEMGSAQSLRGVQKIEKMMAAFPEFRQHIEEKFGAGGALAAASSPGGQFLTSEGVAFSYGSMIPGRGRSGGAKSLSGVLSALGLTTASRLVREQDAEKIAEYMMTPEQRAEYEAMQDVSDRRKIMARAADISGIKLKKAIGSEEDPFDPNKTPEDIFNAGFTAAAAKIAAKEEKAGIKSARQDQLASMGLTQASVRGIAGVSKIWEMEQGAWDAAVSIAHTERIGTAQVDIAHAQAAALSPEAYRAWQTEVAKLGNDPKNVMPNVAALGTAQAGIDERKLRAQQADISADYLRKKMGILGSPFEEGEEDTFGGALDEGVEEKEQVSRAKALNKSRRMEARKRKVNLSKVKERFGVEDLSDVEAGEWSAGMDEEETAARSEEAIDIAHKRARVIAPEAYSQWSKGMWAGGTDPSTVEPPDFDVQGKRRGFGILADPMARAAFQLFAARRAWTMFSAPAMQASEQYGMQSSQYAMFEGEGAGGDASGYAARKQYIDTYMGKGAYQQFGEGQKGDYLLARMDTGGVFPRMKAGIQWSAGLIGAGYFAGMSGAALSGMGIAGGGTLAAMGPATAIAGGALLATTIGFEAYNTFFKPAEEKPFGWSTIKYEAAKEIAYQKYRTPEADKLFAKARDLENQIQAATTPEEVATLRQGSVDLRAQARQLTFEGMPEDVRGAIEDVSTGGAVRIQNLVEGTGGSAGLAALTGLDPKELTGAFMQTAKYYGVTDTSLTYMTSITKSSVKNYRTTSETQRIAMGVAQATGVRMGTAEYKQLEAKVSGMSATQIDNLEAKTSQYARYAGSLSGYFADSRDAAKFVAANDIRTEADVRGIQAVLGAASQFGYTADEVVGYGIPADTISGGRRTSDVPITFGEQVAKMEKELGAYKTTLAASLQSTLMSKDIGLMPATTAFKDWGLTSASQVETATAAISQASSFGYTGMDAYNAGKATVGLNQWQYSTLSGVGNKLFEGGASAGGVGAFYQMAGNLSNQDMSLMSKMAGGDMGAWSYKAWQDGTYENRWLDQAGRPINQYRGADFMRMGMARAVAGDPTATRLFSRALAQYQEPNMASSITGMNLGTDFNAQAALSADPVKTAMALGMSPEYAQAFAGEGFTTKAGDTFTGATGMNLLYAQKQYGFQMGSAGIQLAQLNAQRAFYWGSGSWDNPAPGSMWNLEDRMRELQRSSSLAGFAAQEQRMSLGNQYAISQENLNLQRMNAGQQFQRWSMGFDQQTNLMQRGFAREDYAYGRQMSNLQFGWQMEDIDEQLRMSSGRERRLLTRQKERATIGYNLETGHAEDVQSRQEQMWAREDERFEKTKQYQEELMTLDKQGFELSKSQREDFYKMDQENLARNKEEYEAQYKLQEEITALQREHQAEMMKFQEQSIGLQAAAAAAAMEYAENLAIQEERYKEMAGTWAEGAKYDPTFAMKAIVEFSQKMMQIGNEAGNINVATLAEFRKLIGDLNNMNLTRLQQTSQYVRQFGGR